LRRGEERGPLRGHGAPTNLSQNIHGAGIPSALKCGRGRHREASMKFMERLMRFVCAGLFVMIGPRPFDFEIERRHNSITKS
jgi:hypothetical protein